MLKMWIGHMGMPGQAIFKEVSKQISLMGDALHQVLLFKNFDQRQTGDSGHRMMGESPSMHKGTHSLVKVSWGTKMKKVPNDLGTTYCIV